MDYAEAVQVGNDLLLTGVRHFDLDATLDCGQAFRYEKIDGGYQGIAYGRRMEINMINVGGRLAPPINYKLNTAGLASPAPMVDIVLKDVNPSEFESTWKDYFDLSRDYGNLRGYLVEHGGEPMKLATEFSPGLRHMRQDPWEMLVSFILSQNTNIPRIKTMIGKLCESFGDSLPCGGHTFPSSEKLAAINANDLAVIKCGYRAVYLIDAARRTADGRFNPIELKKMETSKIREELLKIHGVGPKVADCVLLIGFGRVEVCPVDVWIKRALAKYYPKGFPVKLAPYAGIAQQFLFHFIRNSNL